MVQQCITAGECFNLAVQTSADLLTWKSKNINTTGGVLGHIGHMGSGKTTFVLGRPLKVHLIKL